MEQTLFFTPVIVKFTISKWILHADWSRAMDCEVIDHGNDVTCHTLCGWFSEKLHRKLKINVIVKNKSTTIFHGLHSYRSQKWRHKTFKNLQWNHSPFDFLFFDSTSCFMTWEQQALWQLLLVSNQLVVDILGQKC